MNITVIGAGYVGLVTGACFAELGNRVTCVDVDEQKISALTAGMVPFFEPGLESMIKANIAALRLYFATSLAQQIAEPDVIFIAVGTPSDSFGAADTQFVLKAAKTIGETLNRECIIVDKSTVPPGMADEVYKIVKDGLLARHKEFHVEVVSNPEFLREGAAIEDFMHPDRIIIGLSPHQKKAKRLMSDLYLPILRNQKPIYFMSVKDAEMTKYVANAMLATRISFMNEMALLCEKIGVDIENVRIGIGSDSRIGSAFLYPGCGYGGSCFPKDVRALIRVAEDQNLEPILLQAVEKRNHLQKEVLANKIFSTFGNDLSDITIALWGLSFKPETDDMREASSLIFLEKIIKNGGKIKAYDPAAMPVARKMLPKEWFDKGKIELAKDQWQALQDVDALALVTEWKPFSYPDIAAMKKSMRRAIIFDGRNLYDPEQMRAMGFAYYGIGRSYSDAV